MNKIEMEKIKSRITEFFNKGDKRTLQAKKNIVASFLIKGVSIAVNLILVPLTINYVNPTQYGIWLTLSSFVAWFSFFDIGFGNGLRNKFAEARAIGDNETARIYVSTTYYAVGTVFCFIWLMFLLVNQFLDWTLFLNAPSEMFYELTQVSMIVFSFFCLQIVLKLIGTILIADQKNAKAGLIEMLGQLGALIIVFILTKSTTGSLFNLALALGIAPTFSLLISSLILFRGKYQDVAPSVKFFKISRVREILGLGIKFFFIQIAVIVVFQSTNFIISHTQNPDLVTVYNIAYKYFFVVVMAFTIIVSPMWSAFTDAFVLHDYAWMQSTVKKLEKIWLLFIPMAIIMLFVSNTVYQVWIGDKVSIPFYVSMLMSIFLVLYSAFNMYVYMINGIGKIRVQLVVYVIACIMFIPLAILMSAKWGLVGILIANIIVVSLLLLVIRIQLFRLITRKAQGIWNL